MKKLLVFILSIMAMGCGKPKDDFLQGKIEREQLGVVSKIPGKITEIRVKEGDIVKKGDTLIVLDLPEIEAKKYQAQGAVQSAKAQYDMTLKGATNNQIKQLEAKEQALKEQFDFASKSLERLGNMLKDSLVSQQAYDEVFAKYQGAKSQYMAVQSEISDVKYGARIEQQMMALGQQERAFGVLQEVNITDSERFIIAPADLTIESVSLKVGELALPGYTLINASLATSTYFRFTIPESRLSKIKKGQDVKVKVVYNNKEIAATVASVKALGAYANIATAYPDYELQESLFELKIYPVNTEEAIHLFAKATVTLSLL